MAYVWGGVYPCPCRQRAHHAALGADRSGVIWVHHLKILWCQELARQAVRLAAMYLSVAMHHLNSRIRSSFARACTISFFERSSQYSGVVPPPVGTKMEE